MTIDTNQNPTPVEKKPRHIGRIVARNMIFGMGAQIALKFASFLFSVLVIRNFGDDIFGQYSIVLAWAGLFSVLGDLGISQYWTREIARDQDNASNWFWDIVVLRFGLAIAASIVTVGGAVLYGYSTDIVIGIAVFTISFFFQAFLQPLTSILTGNERIDLTSVLNVIGQVVYMILGSLVLLAGLNYIWLILLGMINLPLLIVLTIWSIRRNKFTPRRFHINPPFWRKLLIAGFPFALTQLSLSFAFSSDTIILSGSYSDSMVGWYATAYRLMTTLFLVSQAFNEAIFPSLSREHALNPQSINAWYFRTVKAMILFTLPLAMGSMLLSDKIIQFLYGDEFAPAAIAFGILVWYLPFHFYTAFAGNLSNTMKYEKASAKIYGFEGLLNIVLNILLIPPLGMIGASFATVLTMFAGTWLFYFHFRRTVGAGLEFRRILKMILATLLMIPVVWLLRDQHLFISVLGGAITYLVVAVLLGTINESEIRIGKQIFAKFRGVVPVSS